MESTQGPRELRDEGHVWKASVRGLLASGPGTTEAEGQPDGSALSRENRGGAVASAGDGTQERQAEVAWAGVSGLCPHQSSW